MSTTLQSKVQNKQKWKHSPYVYLKQNNQTNKTDSFTIS